MPIASKLRGAYKRTTDASIEPVTLAEAKLHLRVDVDDDDDLITEQIETARNLCETFTARQFIEATYRLKLDRFPFVGEMTAYSDPDGSIIVPKPPLLAVSSIRYVDTDGNVATATSSLYTADTDSEPGRIALAWGKSWPDARAVVQAVTVNYTAGYTTGTTAALVRSSVKSAMKLYLAHWYNNREEVSATVGGNVVRLPVGAETILWGLRVVRFS